MGQEILYCYWCSSRILGADFDKGAAVIIGNHACCPSCLPKVLSSLPEAQRQTVLNLLNKDSAQKPTRNTPRGGTEISSTKTPRATPQVPDAPAAKKPPIVPIAAGVGALLLIVIFALMFGSGSSEGPKPVADPGPAPSPTPRPPDRDQNARSAIDKARDAARSGIDIDLQVRLWEEAVAKSERTPLLGEATQERTAILARRKEVYAQELARLGESVEGVVRQEEFKKAIDVLTSARKRHELPEWAEAIDKKIDEVKKADSRSVPFRQGTDADNLVCVEAEHYSVKIDQGDHAWTLVTAPAGFQGPGAMAALPNTGAGWVSNYAATSPRLDFKVQFLKAGKHYLWIRGWAESGNDDSVHLGLDGKELKSSMAVSLVANKKWNWTTKTMANAAGFVEVPAPGLHTVNLWMREDGAIVDRIVLTTNAKYAPKDPGPPESPR